MQAVTFGRIPNHYTVVSVSDIVDILALKPPEVSWATPDQVESAMAAAEKLGAV